MPEPLHGASTGMTNKRESQQYQEMASHNKAILPTTPYTVVLKQLENWYTLK